MDITYVLGLELTDPGFDFSVLVPRFALAWLSIKRSIVSQELLVAKLSEQGYLKNAEACGRIPRTFWRQCIDTIGSSSCRKRCVPPRVQVAAQAPEWLQQWVPIDWFKRYECRIEEARLSIKKEEQEAFLEQVGQDGSQLLSMLYQEDTPALLAHLPQVQILRQIWITNFSFCCPCTKGGRLMLPH